MTKIKENKGLQVLPTSLMLDKNENLFLEESTSIMETRSVRVYRGASGRVRITKGLSIGQSKGRAESHKEWRTLDVGKLSLTNKKLIFNGRKEDRIVQLSKIVDVTPMLDAIEVTSSTRSSTTIFPVKNPYIWATALRILKAVDDPLSLGELKLDVQFQ